MRVEIDNRADARAQAVAAARTGARVLWIRSTVAEAVLDRTALADHGVRTVLHHSRYAHLDRVVKDREVLAALGKEALRDGDGIIVVGTQTVEQSLDIDADLLVTDAVPADVMLQRWGRLHRWDRRQQQRPRPLGFETPLVRIIAPGAWEPYLPEPSFKALPPQGWRWVYPVPPVVATIEFFEREAQVALPRDQRRLVEAATHRDALRAFIERGDRWAAAWQCYVNAGGVGRQLAGTALVDRKDQYGYGTAEALATRLGDPTIMVRTPGLVSPLNGAVLEEVGVPLRWWRDREPSETAIVHCDAAGVATLTVGALTMRYTADGLVRVRWATR